MNKQKITEKMRWRAPTLHRLAQFVWFGLRFVRRHPLFFLTLIASIVFLVVIPLFNVSAFQYRFWLWGAAGILLVFSVLSMAVASINEVIRRMSQRENIFRQEITTELSRKTFNQKDSVARQINQIGEQMNRHTDSLIELKAEIEKKLSSRSTEYSVKFEEVVAEFGAKIDQLSTQYKTQRDKLDELEKSGKSDINNLIKEQDARLKTALEKADLSSRREIDSAMNQLQSELEKVNVLEGQIDKMLGRINSDNFAAIESAKIVAENIELNREFIIKFEKHIIENTDQLSDNSDKLAELLGNAESFRNNIENQISELRDKNDEVANKISDQDKKSSVAISQIRESHENVEQKVQKLAAAKDSLSDRIEQEEKRNSTAFSQVQEELEQKIDVILSSIIDQEVKNEGRQQTVESLTTQITAVTDAVSELKDGTPKVAEYSEEFTKKVADLEQSLALMSDELKSSGSARETELSKKLEELEKSLATIEEATKADKPNHNYQRFNRALSKSSTNELLKSWAKPLGVEQSVQSLSYAAHRVEILENQLKGRLATSVEDMIVRTIVSQAVNGDSVNVLEIGTLFGIGVAVIYDRVSSHYKHVNMTVIDPFEGYYGNNRPDVMTREFVNRANFLFNMSAAGIADDAVTIIEGFSTDPKIIEIASKQTYDVLIIDGDHSYAGVKSDFVNFRPFVKQGGYIIIDDYGTADWPEIQKYVDEEVTPREDVALIGVGWRTAVFRVISN